MRSKCPFAAACAYGNTANVELFLKQTLLDKGVPERVVEQGKEHDPDVWTRLKDLADAKKFRWVTRDELKLKPKVKAAPPNQHSKTKQDPWANGKDPWSASGSGQSKPAQPETFEVCETFQGSDGNQVMAIEPAQLRPGAVGYSMVAPHELSSIVAVFDAAKPVEPCLALCPEPVPGLKGTCQQLLVKSSQTQRLKQLPVNLHQLGQEQVQLQRDAVVEVKQVDAISLVLHGHQNRMTPEDWQAFLAAPVRVLQKLVPQVADYWFSWPGLLKAPPVAGHPCQVRPAGAVPQFLPV